MEASTTTFYAESGERYVAEETLNAGGMGAVRLVRSSSGEPFALKTLTLELDHPDALGHEARSLAQIKHPNVVRYVDYGTDPMPFLVMELVDDGDLASVLQLRQQSGEHFPITEVVDITAQALTGLSAIHERLVHRDLKPQNLLLDGGTLKIADFGLAKVLDATTSSHTFKGWGTARYQPPESWIGTKGASSAAAYDLYSLGVIVYELATLRTPFEGSRDDLRRAHMFEAPLAPRSLRGDIPPQLESIILQLLAKDPAERGGSAEEMLSVVSAIGSRPPAPNPSGPAPALDRIRQGVAVHLQAKSEAEAERLRLAEEKAEREARFVVGAEAFFSVVDAAAEVVRQGFAPLTLHAKANSLDRMFHVDGLKRQLSIELRPVNPDYFRSAQAPGEIIGFGAITIAEPTTISGRVVTAEDVKGGANVVIYLASGTEWVPRLQLIELRSSVFMGTPMRPYEPFYLDVYELAEHGRYLWGGPAHVFSSTTIPATEENLIAWFGHLVP